MKKIIIGMLSLLIFLLLGCDNLCSKTEREITETIGNRTCTGKGVDKIEGWADCKTQDGRTFTGDIWGHAFNGKGKVVASNGDVRDGYFYDGVLVAGKFSKSNGDAAKGLWSRENGSNVLELGKSFTKSNGSIELGEFGNFGLKYGMKKYNNIFYVGDFIQGSIFINNVYNGYLVNNNGCSKVLNGKSTEITRTVTKTVYRNNGIQLSTLNPLGDLYKLGSKYNPYTVKLELK